MGLKKEFKRSSDFSSRSSRPDSFSDVSRGREVIVRRESLSTTSSSIDPRQVKERYTSYFPILRYIIFIKLQQNSRQFNLILYLKFIDMIAQVQHLILVNAKYDVPSPRRIEAPETVIRDIPIVSNLRDPPLHVSMINHMCMQNGFNIYIQDSCFSS